MTLVYKHRSGFEVWANFDATADIYELFASQNADDYLGCADTLAEARKIAKTLAEDLFNI